jgi:hypothetical protein
MNFKCVLCFTLQSNWDRINAKCPYVRDLGNVGVFPDDIVLLINVMQVWRRKQITAILGSALTSVCFMQEI